MKRNLLLIMILWAMTVTLYAQKPSAQSIGKRLSLGFGINNDIWMNVPDSINSRKVNQGVDVFVNYIFPMDKRGHIAFFIGGGIGAHNFYDQALLGVGKYNLNGVLPTENDVTANESYFYNVPATFKSTAMSVKKSKLSITYFDIPFGFQYKATNKIHATLGFKVGWKLNAHTKYVGTAFDGSGRTVKDKSSPIQNIDNFHYGPYAVIGYKWFGISVFYQLSSVFLKDLGPQIYPVSVGLVFKPF